MVFASIAPLFILFMCGYLLKRLGVLEHADSRVLSRILLLFILPCVVVRALLNVPFQESVLSIPLAAALIFVILLCAGYVLGRLFHLENKMKGAFITLFPTLQIGSMGYPFVLALYGDVGVSRMVLFDVVAIFFVFIVMHFVSYRLGRSSEDLRFLDTFKTILKNPNLWAVCIGVGLNVLGVSLPVLPIFLDVVSGATIPVAMIYLGLEFSPSASLFGFPLFTVFLKSFTGLGVGWMVATFLGLESLDKTIVLIASFLPASLIALVYAKEHHLDVKYTSDVIALSQFLGLMFLSLFALVMAS